MLKSKLKHAAARKHQLSFSAALCAVLLTTHITRLLSSLMCLSAFLSYLLKGPKLRRFWTKLKANTSSPLRKVLWCLTALWLTGFPDWPGWPCCSYGLVNYTSPPLMRSEMTPSEYPLRVMCTGHAVTEGHKERWDDAEEEKRRERGRERRKTRLYKYIGFRCPCSILQSGYHKAWSVHMPSCLKLPFSRVPWAPSVGCSCIDVSLKYKLLALMNRFTQMPNG